MGTNFPSLIISIKSKFALNILVEGVPLTLEPGDVLMPSSYEYGQTFWTVTRPVCESPSVFNWEQISTRVQITDFEMGDFMLKGWTV